MSFVLKGEDREGTHRGGSGNSTVNHVRVVLDQGSPKISSSPHPFCSGIWDHLCVSIRQTLFSSTICSTPSCPDFSCSLWCWLIPGSARREGFCVHELRAVTPNWPSSACPQGHREGLFEQEMLIQPCSCVRTELRAVIAATLAPQRSWIILCNPSKSELAIQHLNGNISIF